MKKVLVGYVSSYIGNGIDKYLGCFYKCSEDKNIQFDFLTKSNVEDVKKVFNEDANVIKISQNRKFIKQFFELRKIIKKGDYDVAYFNISETYNCIGILAAKIFGIKKIVVHSHCSGSDKSNKISRFFYSALNFLCKPIIYYCSNKNLACSKKAAKWLFSNKIVRKKSYELIYNAIDYDKFKPNEKTRDDMREKYNLKDKFVVGHVGRFSYQKNHEFLIEIFEKIKQKNKNTVLVCIGEGENLEKIKDMLKTKNLENDVIFTGNIKNVNEFMQAFDVFLLPSRFEGLPIVGVEAQIAGVPCLFSDKISDEIIISSNSKLLSIEDSSVWAENALKIQKTKNSLLKASENFKLENISNQFEQICNNSVNENNSNFFYTALNILLSTHFLLNLTSTVNGFNYLILPVSIILIFIIILYLINIKKLIKDKFLMLLVLFVGSYLLTTVFSKNYEYINTIKVGIWMIIHLFFVFFVNALKNKSNLKKELNIILMTILIIFSIINGYNAYLLFNEVSGITHSFDGQPLIYGLSTWGRFYGIFYDPNYASVICGCCVLFSLYFYKKYKNIILKTLMLLCLALQSLYMIFCESRTCKVAFFVGLLVYIVLSTIKKYKKKFILPTVVNVVLVTLIAFYVPNFVINCYNDIKSIQNSNNFEQTEQEENNNLEQNPDVIILEENEQEENNNLEQNPDVIIPEENEQEGNENSEPTTENNAPKPNDNEGNSKNNLIGREDVLNGDISNRRFDIWKSGIEIFKTKPVFGIGFANITGYALDNNPNTYIVNNDFTIFNTFHNVVIDILVSQGVIGIIIFILMIIFFTHFTIRKISNILFNKDNWDINILLLSSIALILASAMFVSEIFYVNNACTYLFWLLIGYYYFINKDVDKDDN